MEVAPAHILRAEFAACDGTRVVVGSRQKNVWEGRLSMGGGGRGRRTATLPRGEGLEFNPLGLCKDIEGVRVPSCTIKCRSRGMGAETCQGSSGRHLGFGVSGRAVRRIHRSNCSAEKEPPLFRLRDGIRTETAARLQESDPFFVIGRKQLQASKIVPSECKEDESSVSHGLLPTTRANVDTTMACHSPNSQPLVDTKLVPDQTHSFFGSHSGQAIFQILSPLLVSVLHESITSLSVIAAVSLALFSCRSTSVLVPGTSTLAQAFCHNPNISSSTLPAAMARISSSLPHQTPSNPVPTATLHTPLPTPPPSASPTPATSPSQTCRAMHDRSQSAPSTPRLRSAHPYFAIPSSTPTELHPLDHRIRIDVDRPSASTRSSPTQAFGPVAVPMLPPARVHISSIPPNSLRYRVTEFDAQRGRSHELLSDFFPHGDVGGDTEQPSTSSSSSLPSSPSARPGFSSGLLLLLPRRPPPRPPSVDSPPGLATPSVPGPSDSHASGQGSTPAAETPGAFMDDLAGRACQSSPTAMTRVAAVVPGLDEMRPDPLVVFVGGPGRRRKSNTFVKQAADKVGPAVVRLDTERDAPAGDGDVGEDRDRLFRQWFGDSDLQIPRKFRRERGQGSGFVLDGREGTIITNAHVVKGADRVKVTFTDGRVFEGEVTGTDEVTDLALVKVDTRDGGALPKAPLGDSSTVELGDWVIAVGNPFGLDNTISLGIISNLHRTAAEVGIPDKRLDFLQTDCAINPGNSGGPLLNEFGEVIGINTAIRADAEGIAFAIPINNARRIIETLGQGKPVRHPFLGIQMATLTPDLARQYNADPNTGVVIPEMCGVLVVKVSPQSPAAVAGLRFGDVVIEVEGKPMRVTSHLQKFVEASTVGQALRMKVRRGERDMDLLVRTGDMSPFFGIKRDNRENYRKPTQGGGGGGGAGGSSSPKGSSNSSSSHSNGKDEATNNGCGDSSRCDPSGCLGDEHHHSTSDPPQRPRPFDHRHGLNPEFPPMFPSRNGRGSFGGGDFKLEWERVVPDQSDLQRTDWT